MTAAASKKRSAAAGKSDAWKRLNAQIRAGCQQLGLDEEARRDLIERTVGKRSLGDCTDAQMRQVRDAVGKANPAPGFRPGKRKGPARAGDRALASGEVQAKLRALWISGYHLGVVRSPEESALVAFVRRVTGGRDRGIAALEWLSIDGGRKAVEAVKALLARDAGVSWEPYRAIVDGRSVPVERPRARVLEAQWRRLHARGAVQIADTAALAAWCCRHVSWPCHADHTQLDAEAQDRCIEALGRWLRRVMTERGEIQEGNDR